MGLFRKETATVQGCSGCAVLGGIGMGIFAIAMFIAPAENAERLDSVGAFACGAIGVIPGLIAWFWVTTRNKELDFSEAVLGTIRNHERFTVGELAQKIGRNELQTERLIASLSNRTEDLNLVFHRSTRQYIHLSVLQSTATVVENCPKCGAPQGRQVILEGERANCTHCDAMLV